MRGWRADNMRTTCADDMCGRCAQTMCTDDVRVAQGVVLHEIGQLRQVFAWVWAINLTSNNQRSGKSGKYLPGSGLLIWLVTTTKGLVNQTRGSHLGQLCIKPTGLLVSHGEGWGRGWIVQNTLFWVILTTSSHYTVYEEHAILTDTKIVL